MDAAVTPVGYVDVAGTVDGYSPRLVELPRSIAQPSPTGKRPAVAREVLDPVIHAVYDIQVVVTVEDDTGRAVQLPLARAGLAPLSNTPAVRAVYAYDIPVLVRAVESAVSPDGQARRPAQLAAAPKVAQELLVDGKLTDAPVLGDESTALLTPAQDVEDAAGGDRNGGRLAEPVAIRRYTAYGVAEAPRASGHCAGQHIPSPA